MKKNSISLVMPIYNQESIIDSVLDGIYNNISKNVEECIYILDGCTDDTEKILWLNLVKNRDTHVENKVIMADNVNEVIACNMGFRLAECEYVLNLQDDMIMREKNFDQRLLKPFEKVDSLLGVTGRNAQNETIKNGSLHCFDVAGKDVNSPRNLFAVRDVIVRGPILWDKKRLESLDYLDEEFAPLDSDDKDLSIRGYYNGYKVGSYVVDYQSNLSWGTTRKNPTSNRIWAKSAQKNIALLIKRHKEFLLGEKHSEDIII